MRKPTEVLSWLKFVFAIAIGALIVIAYCVINKISQAEDTTRIIRILCDSFTIAGIVLLCIGLLTVINKEGIFDGIGYSLKSVQYVAKSVWGYQQEKLTYYDYKQELSKKRQIAFHFIIVGGAFLLIGIVFILIDSSISANV